MRCLAHAQSVTWAREVRAWRGLVLPPAVVIVEGVPGGLGHGHLGNGQPPMSRQVSSNKASKIGDFLIQLVVNLRKV